MRSRGWVAIENGTSKEALHFHEVKTVGPVTIERHQYPYQRNGLFWMVNGERFDKLKDAVKRADLIMAEAGWVQG